MILLESVLLFWYVVLSCYILSMALKPSMENVVMQIELKTFNTLTSNPIALNLQYLWIAAMVLGGVYYFTLPVTEVFIFYMAIRIAILTTAKYRGLKLL